MTKFELTVVKAGEPGYRKTVYGFAEAEKAAYELLAQIDGCNLEDSYIVCNEYPYVCGNIYALTRDSDGEAVWKTLVVGEYCPVGVRLMTRDEELLLELWRSETERHIEDLDLDELAKLYSEVTFGSIYYSDYTNSLGVDEHEVADICDEYDKWLMNEGVTDDANEFANYVYHTN